MALSPWPTTPAALQTATAELRTALGLGTNTSNPFVYDARDAEVQRVAGAVSARIEEYANAAPDAAKDEALIRGCAWLRDTKGAIAEATVGPLTTTRPSNSAAWFLHAGCAALLTRWKIRRAGVI